jgi:hypothetical protein
MRQERQKKPVRRNNREDKYNKEEKGPIEWMAATVEKSTAKGQLVQLVSFCSRHHPIHQLISHCTLVPCCLSVQFSSNTGKALEQEMAGFIYPLRVQVGAALRRERRISSSDSSYWLPYSLSCIIGSACMYTKVMLLIPINYKLHLHLP